MDPRILRAEEALRPILDEQAGLGPDLFYPGGQSGAFISRRWGGVIDDWFTGFVQALQADYRAWVRDFAGWMS